MGNMFRCTLKSGGASGTGIPLIVTCSEDFAGKTITATDGTTTLTETCPSASPYTIQFDLPNTGSWTISGVIEGQTYSETIAVTEYQLSLDSGFNYKTWVSRGGLDPDDYASLSAVFADEAAVRRLMLVHASADYLIDCVTDDITEIDDFCANDTAMKWLGLCDYVCDGLTAITGVKAKLLASAYWERYLKDHVPVMTSNTAPYGTVSGSSGGSNVTEPWKSFDGGNYAPGYLKQNSLPCWLNYKFVVPICVKKFTMTYTNRPAKYFLEASNDGTNYETLLECTDDSQGDTAEYTVNNDNYYLNYRIRATQRNAEESVNVHFGQIQFYGRALNVSVPVMTSNTAPFGEASGTDNISNAYNAFDGSLTTSSSSSSGVTSAYIQYKFKTPVKLVKYSFNSIAWSGVSYADLQVAYSDDGTNFTNLGSAERYTDFGNNTLFDKESDEAHLYWRITRTISQAKQTICTEVQFYGLDYSEKEFEAGTSKKWLYDHGVELEAIGTYTSNASCVASKLADYIHLETIANQSAVAYNDSAIDLTNYTVLRAIFDPITLLSSRIAAVLEVAANKPTAASWAGIASTTLKADAINTAGLDISSIDQSAYVGIWNMSASGGVKFNALELWVE